MLRARLFTFVALLVVGSLWPAGLAVAADPLGLTPDGGVGETLGLGTDRVAVWVCEIPGTTDPKTFTPEEVADWANSEIAPFFSLISRGRYLVEFVAAGRLTLDEDCLDDALALTVDASFSNVLVIDDTDAGGGLGGSGIWYLVNGEVVTPGATTSPSVSGRGFHVGGGTFELPATATHEVGHTLAWPHSGSTTSGLSQYDNVGDLMSGHGVDNLCPISATTSRGPCKITHTLAFNRYTSGWIDSVDIPLITKPAGAVDLVGPEAEGAQFALIPSADPLVFTTVEARPAVGYDVDAGVSGVMLHTIDGTAGCSSLICWGLNRRQHAAVGGAGSTDHILAVGESVAVHGVTVTVDAAIADGYTVTFSGTPQGCAMGPNRFVDVSRSSFAFNDIGCIRLLGITTGTGPTTYSPLDSVTREQMAAFLARLWRALGQTCSAGATPFLDIAGSFAEADVACIYALDVTTGVSSTQYDPHRAVTREQMAAFLARLWRALGQTCSAGATPFLDIAGSFAEADVACIHALDITTGTTSTTYSPTAVVTRDQMASFLARFWKRA